MLHVVALLSLSLSLVNGDRGSAQRELLAETIDAVGEWGGPSAGPGGRKLQALMDLRIPPMGSLGPISGTITGLANPASYIFCVYLRSTASGGDLFNGPKPFVRSAPPAGGALRTNGVGGENLARP